ncbi:MAG: precorrin-2 C(20)-methyltransferase [Nitrospirae bacterium]|nr:precorrin-2 C(20)-methyltransferase [Nitrospirota bacterium]MCL5284494.1 precorrin-2 C(20)-methyltransferase [Nitrospirota bacterium]
MTNGKPGSASEEEPLRGTLYGIGVGPGDPELLTLKAARILGEVPVIAVPTSYSDAGSMAMEVIAPLLEERKRSHRSPEIVSLLFPMTRDETVLREARMRNGELLLGALSRGDVAFVALGDILFYSTFGNLLTGLFALRSPVPVEVVPGVTSYSAAAGRLVEPLVQGSERLAVLPAVYDPSEIEEVLERFEVVVLMKINKVFASVRDILERKNLLDRSAFVSMVGRPEERVSRTLDELAPGSVPYMSLLVVRKNGWLK